MRLRNIPPEEEIRRLEELLRGAADYQPSRRAPEGLAHRALQGRRLQTRPRFRLSPVPVGGLILVALLAVAVVYRMEGRHPDLPAEPTKSMASAGLLPPPDLLPPIEKSLPNIQPVRSDQKETRPEPEAIRKPSPAAFTHSVRRSVHRLSGTPSPRNPGHVGKRLRRPTEPPAAPRLPKAIWKNYTVRRYVSGLVTPALVARQDPDSRTVSLTPAVVEVPLENGHDSPTLRSSEETGIWPASFSGEEGN